MSEGYEATSELPGRPGGIVLIDKKNRDVESDSFFHRKVPAEILPKFVEWAFHARSLLVCFHTLECGKLERVGKLCMPCLDPLQVQLGDPQRVTIV